MIVSNWPNGDYPIYINPTVEEIMAFDEPWDDDFGGDIVWRIRSKTDRCICNLEGRRCKCRHKPHRLEQEIPAARVN